MKRILLACEFSGIVRNEFSKIGWDAWSCDFLPSESPGNHIKRDVREVLNKGWDMMIAFPPCKYLTVAGNRSRKKNGLEVENALEFVRELMDAPIEKIVIENPIGVISSIIRKPDQIVRPYYFGDKIDKPICLWLKNVPKLRYSLVDTLFEKKTSVAPEYILYNSKKTKSGKSRYSIFGKLGKGKGKERSVFFNGIARAMAEQWGK